ncbi:hypothetical protein H6785_00895 [Candidatus Nomurabacteria bacterium]|nr:hypothetical protein [Candidatus Nomurabacteria bacterium]
MKKTTALASLLLLPVITHAESLQTFFTNFIQFLSNIVIPFLLGIAFLFFVINAFRFFIYGGDNEEDQTKAKTLAIYSISAFILIITFWGIINLLVSSLGFGGVDQPPSDYVCPDGLCPENQEPDWIPPIDNPCNDPTNPACNPGRA